MTDGTFSSFAGLLHFACIHSHALELFMLFFAFAYNEWAGWHFHRQSEDFYYIWYISWYHINQFHFPEAEWRAPWYIIYIIYIMMLYETIIFSRGRARTTTTTATVQHKTQSRHSSGLWRTPTGAPYLYSRENIYFQETIHEPLFFVLRIRFECICK